MEVVIECQLGGINEIYVSSVTCRPTHEIKVNSLNKLLFLNAYTYNYQYINNDNITPHLLWEAGLYHNRDGTRVLANNFLEHVNRSFKHKCTGD